MLSHFFSCHWHPHSVQIYMYMRGLQLSSYTQFPPLPFLPPPTHIFNPLKDTFCFSHSCFLVVSPSIYWQALLACTVVGVCLHRLQARGNWHSLWYILKAKEEVQMWYLSPLPSLTQASAVDWISRRVYLKCSTSPSLLYTPLILSWLKFMYMCVIRCEWGLLRAYEL